jgi:3-oxoacyl-[acyl-carrier protein] reductase
MIDLSSKKVLITGGSKGIGKACVELFLRAGAEVFFTYKSGKKSAQEIIKQNTSSVNTKAFRLDLGDIKKLEKNIEKILSEIKDIHILVNNAGIWTYGEVDKMSLEEWDETIQTNLTGTFLLSKAVIPQMKKNNYGRIINITSTAGQRGEPFHSHYAASKGGVISFTKSLAVELGGLTLLLIP